MAETIVIKLEVDAQTGMATVGSLEKDVNKAAKATKGASDNMLDLNAKIDSLSGGALTGFKNFVGGAKGAIKSMGVLKLAIAATGIGLLVTAAAALVEYFTNFEKPLKIVDTVMNAIGGAVNALVESFDLLLSGDIFGFFGEVVDGAEAAIDATNELYEANRQIFEIQKATIVQNAELRAELEKGQKIAADTTLSLEERLKGQEAVNESSERLIENERKLAAAELRRLEAERAIENNYEARRELEIQIEQTTANLISIEAELGRQRQDAAKAEREIIAQDQAIKDTAAKTETESIAALVAARKEALAQIDAALRTANEKEVFDITTKYDELIALARKFGQDTVELERLRKEELATLENERLDSFEFDELGGFEETEATKTQIAEEQALQRQWTDERIAKETAATNKAIAKEEANAKLSIFGGLASSLSGLLGEQTAAGKATALAASLINTYQGITAALAQTTDVTPTQTLRFANAIAVGVAGFASVKKILSTKVPGGKSSGGGGAAPQAPRVGNAIGLINPNQQGEITGQSLAQGLNEQPMRAFVVSENVTNKQNLDDQIQANGQFG